MALTSAPILQQIKDRAKKAKADRKTLDEAMRDLANDDRANKVDRYEKTLAKVPDLVYEAIMHHEGSVYIYDIPKKDIQNRTLTGYSKEIWDYLRNDLKLNVALNMRDNHDYSDFGSWNSQYPPETIHCITLNIGEVTDDSPSNA